MSREGERKKGSNAKESIYKRIRTLGMALAFAFLLD
jgi:hypothetical protein